MPNRCLYIATIEHFLRENPLAVLGSLHNNYHGDALTTTGLPFTPVRARGMCEKVRKIYKNQPVWMTIR